MLPRTAVCGAGIFAKIAWEWGLWSSTNGTKSWNPLVWKYSLSFFNNVVQFESGADAFQILMNCRIICLLQPNSHRPHGLQCAYNEWTAFWSRLRHTSFSLSFFIYWVSIMTHLQCLTTSLQWTEALEKCNAMQLQLCYMLWSSFKVWCFDINAAVWFASKGRSLYMHWFS